MKKREKPRISYIDYGIGFVVIDGNKKYIELNKNLKKYPKLYKEVLNHELKHYNSLNKHIDFWIDFREGFNLRKGWDLFKFSLKYPKAFLSHSPFLFDKKGFSVNWYMLINFIFTISLIIGSLLILI